MKLGISIPPLLLLEQTARPAEVALLSSFGGIEGLLSELKAQGIDSIEVRNLLRTSDPDQGRRACETVWGAGLELTVHGSSPGDYAGSSFGAVYPPVQTVLDNYAASGGHLVMTFNPLSAVSGSDLRELSDRSVALYGEWARLMDRGIVPYTFGIELIRFNPDKADPGATCEGVAEIVRRIANPHVGITWDMGHYYSNVLMQYQAQAGDEPDDPFLDLPPDDFLIQVRHTHIHGIIGRNHTPLDQGKSLPLEHYVEALKAKAYSGVLNLELEFPRFPEDRTPADYTIASIERLRNCL